MTTFDPEIPFETLVRCLHEYIAAGFDASERDNGGNPVGMTYFYDVIAEFPAGNVIPEMLPFRKTLIHFEIDDVDNVRIGFGDQVFTDNYTATPGAEVVFPQEAGRHTIFIDLGVWTSDAAGGVTARLRAMQVLRNLFYGPAAQKALWQSSDGGDGGLKIKNFSGGRFLTERINDVVVYRIVDSSAEIEIFSRTPRPIEGTATIEGLDQAPNLTILD